MEWNCSEYIAQTKGSFASCNFHFSFTYYVYVNIGYEVNYYFLLLGFVKKFGKH